MSTFNAAVPQGSGDQPAAGPVLHVITGPTATGKTERSLSLARELDGEIVSCDSVCVYRGMDIGSAKPTAAERAAIPHHGLDLCDPALPFSVADYVAAAQAAVADIRTRGKAVIICGGSGFYLQAFYQAVTDFVAVSDTIAEEVADIERLQGRDGLLAELRKWNPGPGDLGDLDVNNPRRLASALKRSMATGLTVRQLRAQYEATPGPFDGFAKQTTLLDLPDEALKARIAKRIEAMITAGLLDEVEGLLDQGIEQNPSAASAIGYRETIAYLRKSADAPTSLPDLKALISGNTWKLVKKQRTWFRRRLPDQ